MDVNFSRSDICGEGAVPRPDTDCVKHDEAYEQIVGNNFGAPKKGEIASGDAMKTLNSPRKRRTQSGRTLKAGQ